MILKEISDICLSRIRTKSFYTALQIYLCVTKTNPETYIAGCQASKM